jgi:pimeloyl-ACP methyl ester carboxylesterase
MSRLALIRGALRVVSALSPALAAHIAGRFWFRIPRPPIREATRAFLATGQRFDVAVGRGVVAAWRWGEGPAVILVHGWGGFGGQLQSFVEPLVECGHQVIAFDAPSHGHSGPGVLGAKHATLFEFADALMAMTRNRERIAGVIAHSGGCAAVGWALWKHPVLRIGRLAFIAPFGKPLRYMGIFQRTLGLSDAAMTRFRGRTERQFDFRWEDLDVPSMASRMETPPLLVVHDREDRETAWQDGAEIAGAWPHARLETTTGLGHVRILRDPEVVGQIVQFISESR